VRPPRDAANQDYVRLQQAWQCGLADEGLPCPLGPTDRGCCPAAAACHPLRDGDRWICNRAAERGGPCAAGPGHDGACAVTYRCTPVRALRSRRGRFVVGFFVAAFGAACMAMSGSWRNELIVPGALSVHHAQLVDGANASARCAQCHAAGNSSVGQWLGFAEASTKVASQTSLCMTCHEKTISRELATAAHNVSLAALRGAASAGDDGAGHGRRDAAEPIACSACHREHQGRDHDLAAISDAACQACHRERYHSFAEGHPDFGLWPYTRRTRIAFDHASHQTKHFPADKREFACATCHEGDATGARQLTRGYEAGCAACHDQGLAVSLAQGVPAVALPTLDVAALKMAGYEVGAWPDAADGDFDGRVPWVAQVLVSAKPQAAEALGMLGTEYDFFDVDVQNRPQTEAALIIALELKALADDVAARGDAAIGERLGSVLGREQSPAELQAVGRLEPVDNGSSSLQLKPTGHADAALRAWLDVLAELASGPQADAAEPLLRAALKPTAPGQCGSCHSVERNAAGRLAIQWHAAAANNDALGLTHFAHGAHTLQSQLRDCTACHRVSATPSSASAYASDDPHQFVAQFEPMTKASCVACHTAGAAGDHCTQCHRYHGKSPWSVVRGPWSVVRGPLHAILAPSPATDNGQRSTDN
jgi:hypothetical protein